MVARSLPKAPCCSTSRPVSADWLTWLALLAVLVRRRRRSAAEGEIVSFTYNFPKPGAKRPRLRKRSKSVSASRPATSVILRRRVDGITMASPYATFASRSGHKGR